MRTRLVSALLASTALLYGQGALDLELPAFQPVAGIVGTLNSEGSDTLNNLMTLWTEGFQKRYPSVKIQVQGKGSATAPPALIAGTAQLGPMSREMKRSEIEEFEKKFGYPPTRVRVAIDALAVFVHKDCPLESLNMPEVDAIFSKSRRGGHPRDIRTWGEIGLQGDWADRPISLYGRNSVSGTYGYFKEHALFKGDFKDSVKEQPGSAAVVQGVGGDLYAMGYSGIGYHTSEVKLLAVAPKPGEPPVSTEASNVYSGKYPLSRFLLVYVNKAPDRPLDPLTREFLRFVLSRDGQEQVLKDGYLPLTARMAASELGRL
jgi:phosphate transport system substrate-binding protein